MLAEPRVHKLSLKISGPHLEDLAPDFLARLSRFLTVKLGLPPIHVSCSQGCIQIILMVLETARGAGLLRRRGSRSSRSASRRAPGVVADLPANVLSFVRSVLPEGAAPVHVTVRRDDQQAYELPAEALGAAGAAAAAASGLQDAEAAAAGAAQRAGAAEGAALPAGAHVSVGQGASGAPQVLGASGAVSGCLDPLDEDQGQLAQQGAHLAPCADQLLLPAAALAASAAGLPPYDPWGPSAAAAAATVTAAAEGARSVLEPAWSGAMHGSSSSSLIPLGHTARLLGEMAWGPPSSAPGSIGRAAPGSIPTPGPPAWPLYRSVVAPQRAAAAASVSAAAAAALMPPAPALVAMAAPPAPAILAAPPAAAVALAGPPAGAASDAAGRAGPATAESAPSSRSLRIDVPERLLHPMMPHNPQLLNQQAPGPVELLMPPVVLFDWATRAPGAAWNEKHNSSADLPPPPPFGPWSPRGTAATAAAQASVAAAAAAAGAGAGAPAPAAAAAGAAAQPHASQPVLELLMRCPDQLVRRSHSEASGRVGPTRANGWPTDARPAAPGDGHADAADAAAAVAAGGSLGAPPLAGSATSRQSSLALVVLGTGEVAGSSAHGGSGGGASSGGDSSSVAAAAAAGSSSLAGQVSQLVTWSRSGTVPVAQVDDATKGVTRAVLLLGHAAARHAAGGSGGGSGADGMLTPPPHRRGGLSLLDRMVLAAAAGGELPYTTAAPVPYAPMGPAGGEENDTAAAAAGIRAAPDAGAHPTRPAARPSRPGSSDPAALSPCIVRHSLDSLTTRSSGSGLGTSGFVLLQVAWRRGQALGPATPILILPPTHGPVADELRALHEQVLAQVDPEYSAAFSCFLTDLGLWLEAVLPVAAPAAAPVPAWVPGAPRGGGGGGGHGGSGRASFNSRATSGFSSLLGSVGASVGSTPHAAANASAAAAGVAVAAAGGDGGGVRAGPGAAPPAAGSRVPSSAPVDAAAAEHRSPTPGHDAARAARAAAGSSTSRSAAPDDLVPAAAAAAGGTGATPGARSTPPGVGASASQLSGGGEDASSADSQERFMQEVMWLGCDLVAHAVACGMAHTASMLVRYLVTYMTHGSAPARSPHAMGHVGAAAPPARAPLPAGTNSAMGTTTSTTAGTITSTSTGQSAAASPPPQPQQLQQQQLAVLRRMVECCRDSNEQGRTLLHLALLSGSLPTVRLMLRDLPREYGLAPELLSTPDVHGHTPQDYLSPMVTSMHVPLPPARRPPAGAGAPPGLDPAGGHAATATATDSGGSPGGLAVPGFGAPEPVLPWGRALDVGYHREVHELLAAAGLLGPPTVGVAVSPATALLQGPQGPQPAQPLQDGTANHGAAPPVMRPRPSSRAALAPQSPSATHRAGALHQPVGVEGGADATWSRRSDSNGPSRPGSSGGTGTQGGGAAASADPRVAPGAAVIDGARQDLGPSAAPSHSMVPVEVQLGRLPAPAAGAAGLMWPCLWPGLLLLIGAMQACLAWYQQGAVAVALAPLSPTQRMLPSLSLLLAAAAAAALATAARWPAPPAGAPAPAAASLQLLRTTLSWLPAAVTAAGRTTAWLVAAESLRVAAAVRLPYGRAAGAGAGVGAGQHGLWAEGSSMEMLLLTLAPGFVEQVSPGARAFLLAYEYGIPLLYTALYGGLDAVLPGLWCAAANIIAAMALCVLRQQAAAAALGLQLRPAEL